MKSKQIAHKNVLNVSYSLSSKCKSSGPIIASSSVWLLSSSPVNYYLSELQEYIPTFRLPVSYDVR